MDQIIKNLQIENQILKEKVKKQNKLSNIEDMEDKYIKQCNLIQKKDEKIK